MSMKNIKQNYNNKIIKFTSSGLQVKLIINKVILQKTNFRHKHFQIKICKSKLSENISLHLTNAYKSK